MRQLAEKPRKLPQQSRAKALVEAIEEATARILVREGYDALNTNRVAEVAGVSIGSVYQYYPNKTALVTALWKRHHLRLQNEFRETFTRVDGLPLRAAIRELIAANIRVHHADADVHRALSSRAPEIDFGGPTVDGTDEMHALAHAFFHGRRHEYRPGLDIDAAILMIHKFTETAVHDVVVHRPEMLSNPGLVDEMSNMVVAYLTESAGVMTLMGAGAAA